MTGRLKDLASIHAKMEAQGISLDEIHDVIALPDRSSTARRRTVYAALGLVHSIWRPVPGRFKDYIALPKPNGYQSLHTTVIGPYGERMEMQIRTEEMHRDAELGHRGPLEVQGRRAAPQHTDDEQVRLAAAAARVAAGPRRPARVPRDA